MSKVLRDGREPPAVASTVYHTCLMSEELSLIMSGTTPILMAYIVMAGGSSWV